MTAGRCSLAPQSSGAQMQHAHSSNHTAACRGASPVSHVVHPLLLAPNTIHLLMAEMLKVTEGAYACDDHDGHMVRGRWR